MVILSASARASLPTSCTISFSSSSFCRISRAERIRSGSSLLNSAKYGWRVCRYFEYEMSQFTDGKCLRCASFLSRPQNTWTIPNVADTTGSEMSPPGGETAPTMVTLPSRAGDPRHFTRPARS